jgi:UDP-N-acetylglucosamine 2-epimerase (non-hydrolysing)
MRAFGPEIEASDILSRLKLEPKHYMLVTAHRSENVDNLQNLSEYF